MGGRYHTYIGPYLRCETEVVRVPGGKGHGCVNAICALYKKPYVTPFCAQCGKANEEFEKPPEKPLKVDTWAFQDQIQEALWCPIRPDLNAPVAILSPNVKRDGAPEYLWSDSRDEEGATPFDPQTVTRDKEWFWRAFAPEIAKAKELYGDLKVSVHWGRIVYYS